jgi:hypothetical protein
VPPHPAGYRIGPVPGRLTPHDDQHLLPLPGNGFTGPRQELDGDISHGPVLHDPNHDSTAVVPQHAVAANGVGVGFCWPHGNKPDHGTRQVLWYKNDKQSFNATSNLTTRLRLAGVIPWEAMDDFTRPLTEFHPFRNVQEFLRQEHDNALEGYWRDLLQTQPNHVEVLCEKNTIYHMVLSVTKEYQIPTSSGRGFNSIDPWHDLCVRYKASGKKRLILIVLSDYDPEGQMILQVAGRTLRDDFRLVQGVDFKIVPAGVTRRQVAAYNLPSQNFAKEKSSNLKWFLDRRR